jgi:hypothetical protein
MSFSTGEKLNGIDSSFSDRINRMDRIEKYQSKINPVNPV